MHILVSNKAIPFTRASKYMLTRGAPLLALLCLIAAVITSINIVVLKALEVAMLIGDNATTSFAVAVGLAMVVVLRRLLMGIAWQKLATRTSKAS